MEETLLRHHLMEVAAHPAKVPHSCGPHPGVPQAKAAGAGWLEDAAAVAAAGAALQLAASALLQAISSATLMTAVQAPDPPHLAAAANARAGPPQALSMLKMLSHSLGPSQALQMMLSHSLGPAQALPMLLSHSLGASQAHSRKMVGTLPQDGGHTPASKESGHTPASKSSGHTPASKESGWHTPASKETGWHTPASKESGWHTPESRKCRDQL